jgi:hypothetical protein
MESPAAYFLIKAVPNSAPATHRTLNFAQDDINVLTLTIAGAEVLHA